jgi:hypothetical protein
MESSGPADQYPLAPRVRIRGVTEERNTEADGGSERLSQGDLALLILTGSVGVGKLDYYDAEFRSVNSYP